MTWFQILVLVGIFATVWGLAAIERAILKLGRLLDHQSDPPIK